MNFEQANELLMKGVKMRLPEWRGFWFKNSEGTISALTKDGDIKDAWASGYSNRLDWEIANGLDFGWAITALKAGKLVTRRGWNGRGMFLFLRPSDELSVDMIINKVKSLPQELKDYYVPQFAHNIPEEENQKSPADVKVKFTSYICMKAVDGSIVNGWLASQTDLLSCDWKLFDENE